MPGYIKRFFDLEPIEIGETGRKAVFPSEKKKGDVDAFFEFAPIYESKKLP